MKARIKKLKDVDKTDILPVTHAKAVYVNNDSTLDKALEHIKSDVENIDLSAEKVNLDSTKLKSKTVKEGMEELFQYADNYKKSVANVVGNPILATDKAEQVKSKIQGLKNTLASNLSSKQVSANGTEELNNLIEKICTIHMGYKFASGKVTLPDGKYSTTIQGLSFSPSIIYAREVGEVPSFYVYVRNKLIDNEACNNWGPDGHKDYSHPHMIAEGINVYSSSFTIYNKATYKIKTELTWIALGE